MTKSKLRIHTWQDHIEDCQGVCQPLDYNTFKLVWSVCKGDWARAFLMAGKMAEEQGVTENV